MSAQRALLAGLVISVLWYIERRLGGFLLAEETAGLHEDEALTHAHS